MHGWAVLRRPLKEQCVFVLKDNSGVFTMGPVRRTAFTSEDYVFFIAIGLVPFPSLSSLPALACCYCSTLRGDLFRISLSCSTS